MSESGDWYAAKREKDRVHRRAQFDKNMAVLDQLTRLNPNLSVFTVGTEYRVSLRHARGVVTAKYWPSSLSTVLLFRRGRVLHMGARRLYDLLKQAASNGETDIVGKRTAP